MAVAASVLPIHSTSLPQLTARANADQQAALATPRKRGSRSRVQQKLEAAARVGGAGVVSAWRRGGGRAIRARARFAAAAAERREEQQVARQPA